MSKHRPSNVLIRVWDTRRGDAASMAVSSDEYRILQRKGLVKPKQHTIPKHELPTDEEIRRALDKVE